jgi:hypothetical protein
MLGCTVPLWFDELAEEQSSDLSPDGLATKERSELSADEFRFDPIASGDPAGTRGTTYSSSAQTAGPSVLQIARSACLGPLDIGEDRPLPCDGAQVST